MKTLNIDIETYSDLDIKKVGTYAYVSHHSFRILMFAYSLNRAPVKIVDLANGEQLPDEIFAVLTDATIVKKAWNVNFEFTCISEHFAMILDITQWACTMIKAAQVGLPLKLEKAAEVLKLPEQKDTAGTTLINYFAKPCKPSKNNGGRIRNLPEHDTDKWSDFLRYCVQDVYTEMAVDKKLEFFTAPADEIVLWQLDQDINARGILMDRVLIENAIKINDAYNARMIEEAIKLTGINNPNSGKQLITWLNEEMGDDVDEEIESVKADQILQLLKIKSTPRAKRMLEIKQEISKTSIKKYRTMIGAMVHDMLRGLFQYCGANRTWRWAGRLVQAQNLRRIEVKDIDLARELVRAGDGETLELLFGSVPDILSQLIRTAFIAQPGTKLIVSDFSSIEARVIALLSGEQWKLDVFNTHGKIYEATAASMFRVPLDSVKKTSPERQAAKIAELALGYQGGVNALMTMEKSQLKGKKLTQKTEDEAALEYTTLENCTLEEFVSDARDNELKKIVNLWRRANPSIKNYWDTVNRAAIMCVETKQRIKLKHGIEMYMYKGLFCIQLPSGRSLSYVKPELRPGKFGGWSLWYQGLDDKKRWRHLPTYGGKLVENIVQGYARDCLAHKMLLLAAEGYKIVLHVHDEVVIQEPLNGRTIEDVNMIMKAPIPWAEGLPLNAEGFETQYYKKD